MVLVFTPAVSKFRVHEISFASGWFAPADEIPRCSAFFSCLQFLQIQLKPIFSRSTCQMVLCLYQLFQNSECAKVHLRLDGFLQGLVHWPNENKKADLAGRCMRRDLS